MTVKSNWFLYQINIYLHLLNIYLKLLKQIFIQRFNIFSGVKTHYTVLRGKNELYKN